MRIVIITSGIRGIGSYCYNLQKYMAERGHEVLFVSEAKWVKEPPAKLFYTASTVLFELIPLLHRPSRAFNAIRDFKPDIIHYHWPSGTFNFRFRKLRRMGVPILATLHMAVASRRHLFDMVLYYHFRMFGRHLRHVAGVNCISRFVQEQLLKRFDLPRSKVFLKYAGVNHETFAPGPRTQDGTLRLTFVGQIMPEKGIDVLIKAVQRLSKRRKVVLSIVGSGYLKPLLMRSTKDDPCIRWVGFLKTQKEIAAHYAQSDLTVLPTRWDEAFSLVPIESLSCGTPVMATNKGGTPEIVRPGKTGYLLNACDEDELYQRLLAVNKAELEALRPGCRAEVLERFTLDLMGKNHEELYASIIAASGSPLAGAGK